MNEQIQDKHSLSNALAWFQSIVEMVDAMRATEDEAQEDARERILESVLSVEVRGDWRAPGSDVYQDPPAEYRILLTPGDPALQLVGDLNERGEPETTRLEHQDWGTPWTELRESTLAEVIDRMEYVIYCDVKSREDESAVEFATWQRMNDLASVEKSLAAIDAVKAYLLDFARQFYFGES